MSRFSFGDSPFSQALRAWTMKVSTPAAAQRVDQRRTGLLGVLVVDAEAALHGGRDATAAPRSSPPCTRRPAPARAIRQAPKRPLCTRSDGQPTLRLISS